MDRTGEIEALAAPEGRPPGSDAERRAARHVEDRLRELGRDVAVEVAFCWPAWPLTYALHAALAVGGSVVSVSAPVIGGLLVLAAVVLTFLDAAGVLLTTRRLLGRRATQNVVSRDHVADRRAGPPAHAAKPGTLLLVAHCDSPRRGLRFVHRWLTPVLFGAMVAVLACCVLRIAPGLAGTAFTAIQFLPTVMLIVSTALLIDLAIARPVPADDAGPALALTLAQRHGGRLEHFDLWVLLTGAATAGAHGMHAFLRRHRAQLPRERTVVVDLAGGVDVRFSRREGHLLTTRSHPQLVQLCREVAEDGGEPRPTEFVNRTRGDAAAAAAAGYPAITIAGAAHGEAFCDELMTRIDAELLGEPAP